MKKLLTLFIFLLFLSASASLTFAQSAGIGKSFITPASPLYFLKSVREVLELKSAPTSKIISMRQLEFANRRIREARSLTETPRQDLIEPTLIRYLSHLQELSGMANFSDKTISEEVIGLTGQHMKVLQQIYSQISNVRAKKAVRATVYRLTEWNTQIIGKLESAKAYSEASQAGKLNLSGCDFLSKQASSSALNDIEKSVFKDRAEKCHQGRPL